MREPMALAVALDGTGWHPAAWREPAARPDALFDASYWVDLVRVAEQGGLDFVTFEDALTLQSEHPLAADDRTDQVRGRLDAALVATRVAPATTSIGLVPTITTTHTEPFHVSTRIASLDFVSGGRAGWRVQTLKQRAELEQFGRRQLPAVSAGRPPDEVEAPTQVLFDEAADSVEVVRRLWDSWEDDAEIRDRPTGRFIDRAKLHYVNFEGDFFSVRGPSITPRSPQGQPLVVVLAHSRIPYELAARSADIVFVTPDGADDVARIVREVRAAEAAVGRDGRALRIYADLVVFLDAEPAEAIAAKARLDALDGTRLRSDAAIVATSPTALAEVLVAWHVAGIDGFRLRPGRLPTDLDAIVEGLVPELARRGARPRGSTGGTLRERLGLGPAVNRYSTAVAVGAVSESA